MSEIAVTLSVLTLAALASVLYYVLRDAMRAALDRRVGELTSAVSRADSETFRQLEALIGLYRELEPRRPLPPTRGWAASPDFLAVLARHAAAGPRVIVECGSGTSTVVLARACERNGRGHVWSLEHLPDMAERTRAWLAEQGLSAYATVIDAPLVSQALADHAGVWYSTDELPDLPIDMLVVDGPPGSSGTQARYPAGPRLFPQLSAHGSVFVDDFHRADERAIVARWHQEFPDLALTSVPCEKGAVVLSR